MWVVREGYEGLVRGNIQEAEAQAEILKAATAAAVIHDAAVIVNENKGAQPLLPGRKPDDYLLGNLRFGDGGLLKDGTIEVVGGRTLKGRYIIRVGWDDVRGWYSQVRCRQLKNSTLVRIPNGRF
jgi:6-phosphofructokinase 1